MVNFWTLPFPYIWRTKTKLNNQQKPNSSFKKQIFQKLFLKKAYICPDFFAYRVKGYLDRMWYPPKQTYNLIAAKRRINRHDLYGASAAGRLTAQRRAGLPVRKVRFDSADTQHTVWCHAFKFSQAALYASSERWNARRVVIILPTAFSDLLSVTVLDVWWYLRKPTQ